MKFALVEGGVVVNVIEAEPEIAGELGALPCYEGCGIGEVYAPPYALTHAECLRADIDYLAALQGVTL